MTNDEKFEFLKNKYPTVPEWHIGYFLRKPNVYLGGEYPIELDSISRIDSLFDRFLHPADVF